RRLAAGRRICVWIGRDGRAARDPWGSGFWNRSSVAGSTTAAVAKRPHRKESDCGENQNADGHCGKFHDLSRTATDGSQWLPAFRANQGGSRIERDGFPTVSLEAPRVVHAFGSHLHRSSFNTERVAGTARKFG